jgi:hypothetical protein
LLGLVACGSDSKGNSAGGTFAPGATGSASASSGDGAGGEAGEGSASSAGEGGSAGSSTAEAASSSASTSGAGGAGGGGGAPATCASAPDGTSCTETCHCPPCGSQPPSIECDAGVCQAGACVEFVAVKCKVGSVVYQSCDLAAHATIISWGDSTAEHVCNGSSYEIGYCAPGTVCYVSHGNEFDEGVCQ